MINDKEKKSLEVFENMSNRRNLETLEKWNEITKEIPFIRFDDDWDIKITPPRAGAIVRFNVKKGNQTLSVYLDFYDILGCVGEPYWELYPHKDDVFRCELNETDQLLESIRESFADGDNL